MTRTLAQMLGGLLAAMLLAAMPAQAADTPDVVAKAALRQALGAISQADGVRARELIRSINRDDLPEDQKALATCIAERLEGPIEPPRYFNAPPKWALSAAISPYYEQYWQDVAMQRVSVEAAEETLRQRLVKALWLPDAADWDAIEAALDVRARDKGVGVLTGRTGRLREFMFWASERTEQRDVTLPEGAFNVRITYLDDFKSMGWSRYLSCDRIGTGGWAKPDGLYAVVPAYPSLDDELFRLSFLGHETQHFADYKRFPDLKPWELEYRAKLVELHFAERISPMLIRGFGSATGQDPADSHAYANGRVIAALKSRLGVEDLTTVPLADIQRAALEAILADSKTREAGKP